jgi:lysyl-tRNA synthetase class 1
MTFWADEIVRSMPRDVAHTIHDSKTPSGTVPISALRGPVITDAVFRAFTQNGLTVRFLYGIDDMDPMDAATMKLNEQLAPHMGKPLWSIPAPDGTGDYASYHASRYLATFAGLGIVPETYRVRDIYREGRFDASIDLVLQRAERVREVYRSVANVKRPDDWLPLQVICENCGRIGTTYPRAYDGKTVAYECLVDRAALGRDDEVVRWASGCGHIGRVSPFGGRAKLPYNVEWCAKWDVFNVTWEEAGKDLMTAGGARERSNALFRAVWEKEPPAGITHEFFNLGGKKMSTSKGVGAAAHEIVEIYPAELVRFLMLRTPPQRHVDFDPSGLTLPRLMDDYDRAEQAYTADPSSDLGTIWAYSQVTRGPEPIPFRVKFSIVADWLQIPSVDLARKAEERKGAPLTEREQGDLSRRIALARVWLERWAPDEAKFTVQQELPATARSLSSAQRAFLARAADEIGTTTEAQELQTKLYAVAREVGLVDGEKVSREAFEAIYLAFLGKPIGPRAAWLLATLDPDFVRRRLREASGLVGAER